MKKTLLPALLGLMALPATMLAAQAQQAPFTVVESGKTYRSLQQAVDAIGAGKGSIAVAPGIYQQCAVQEAGQVTYLASEPGTAIFDGYACEGKAVLVLRGESAEVSGLTFQNIEVDDGNGAGIRIERGHLTVAQSWFRDSQQGILSAHDASGRIVVDRSTFTRLGTCAYSAGCAHSIYVGHFGQLRVTRTRFEEGRGGHYLKSRAAVNQIASNSFDDTRGMWTNYMVDLPAGSAGQVTNNWFSQGTHKENHSAIIAVGAESHDNSSTGLQISGNTARKSPNAEWGETTFVADWTGDQLAIGANDLGKGVKRYERR